MSLPEKAEYISDWCDKWSEELARQWLQYGTEPEGIDLKSCWTYLLMDRCPVALWSFDSEGRLITKFERGMGWQVRVDMDKVLAVYDAIRPRGILPDLQHWCVFAVDSCIRDHAEQIIDGICVDSGEIEAWYVPKGERA